MEERVTIPKEVKAIQTKLAPGFAPIDWPAIDPLDPPAALIRRFQSNRAAKGAMKWSLPGPMDEETTRQYIYDLYERKTESGQVSRPLSRAEKEQQEASRAADEVSARVVGFEQAVQERLTSYTEGYAGLQGNDLVSFRELCKIEVQMEDSSRALASVGRENEGKLKLRALLIAEWEKLNVQYRELQKVLGITRVLREQSKESKEAADLVNEAITGTALWMEQHLHILVCQGIKEDGKPCNTEHTWLWWAFEDVHQPAPFYFVARCGLCGTIAQLGDPALRKV